jgi:hypothetical protein
MSTLDSNAIKSFYENELKFSPGQIVFVYTEGARFQFSSVILLRVLYISSQDKFLIVETKTGKTVFHDWKGVGYDSQTDQFFVSSSEGLRR